VTSTNSGFRPYSTTSWILVASPPRECPRPWSVGSTAIPRHRYATDRIVTVTVILIVPGQDPEIRTWLTDPGIEIPPKPPKSTVSAPNTTPAERRAAANTAADLLIGQLG